MTINQGNSGYTLIEIMVALTVFAILATITASALYQAFDTRSRVKAQANRLNAVQLALTLIQQDTEQVIERTMRGDEMHVFPPFIGQSKYLEFTRGGFVNPLQIEARSSLIRVGYLCDGQRLIRRTWASLDVPTRKGSHDKIIFDHLRACTFAYLSNSHQILSEWREYAIRQDQKKETLPQAIQFNVTFEGFGNMSLLYAIPEALYGG